MTGRAEQARARLARSLPAALQTLLDIAVDVARERGLPLYLAGGPVRDALMNRPVSDLDLVVEGDAWPAAEAFARATGGRITRHERFRTAVIEAPGTGWSVDWVTARRERYPSPAALPEVEPASIVEDLARRDFSINALALRLDRDELLDPFGGAADMHHGTIRALHDASFVDDPTRLLRAARFAARWEFELDAHTLELARDAVAGGMIARTSPQRILHELWLTLDEPEPERVLGLLNAWDAISQLALLWSDELAARFAAARDSAPGGAELCEVYLALLIAAMHQRERDQFRRRYNLPSATLRMLRTLPAEPPVELQAAPVEATTLEALLVRYTPAELRALELMSSSAGTANIRRYVEQIRQLPPLLRCDDLKAAGLAPGPLYAEILAEARRKQLEGTLRDAGEARSWLAQRAQAR
jgi:tRNA nucleotidyltransferase (CCA-adding enzyme)